MLKEVHLEKKEHVALITINRPKQLNALNKRILEELSETLNHLEKEKTIRVLILTGAGDKSFVAGADIKEFMNFGEKEGLDLSANGQKSLFDRVEHYPKPIIAAINGYALGGGLELALSTHIRIASKQAKMGFPETTLGLIPGYGGTQRLPQIIGKGRALELILTSKMINAKEGYRIGLINQVCEHEELISTAMDMADAIIKNAPNAQSAAIKAVNQAFTSEGFKVEIEEFSRCFGTDEFKEGVSAFLEKRKPNF